MSLQFFNATGVRQNKAVNEEVIIAESTRASFRLMPAVVAKLGIKDGDYVTMQIGKDENGVIQGVFIGKGKNAVYSTDENGNFILDSRKRKVEDEPGFGALASEQTPGSNILKISVASAWDVLGSSDVKKHFTLSEEGTTVPHPIGNSEFHTTTLYKLEFLKDEAKVVRQSKKAGEGNDEVASDVADVQSESLSAGNALDETTVVEQAVEPVQDWGTPDPNDDF